MKTWFTLLTLLTAAWSLNCDSFGGQSCTLIGCLPSLTVDVRDHMSRPVSRFSGTVGIDGAAAKPFCCEGTSNCENHDQVICTADGFYLMGTPQSLALTVTATAAGLGTYSGTLQPTYDDTYPNGKDCDSTPCKNGASLVELSTP